MGKPRSLARQYIARARDVFDVFQGGDTRGLGDRGDGPRLPRPANASRSWAFPLIRYPNRNPAIP